MGTDCVCPTQARVKEKLDKCLEVQQTRTRIHEPPCEAVLDAIVESTVKRWGVYHFSSSTLFLYSMIHLSRLGKTAKCVNQYDIRLTDSYPECGLNWPSDLKTIKEYLRVSHFICFP